MHVTEALERARSDYRKMLGTLIEVPTVYGYHDYDWNAWHFDQPIRAVVTATPDDDITRICDNFVDPYWNVEVLEPRLKPEHRRLTWKGAPQLLPPGAVLWVDGISYAFDL